MRTRSRILGLVVACAGWLAAFAAPAPARLPEAPKNIIVMISDGCGYNHIDATSYYQYGALGLQVYDGFALRVGMSTYEGEDNGYAPDSCWADFGYAMRYYTDSASAATAMSSGRKTYNGAIGVDMDGQPLLHIADRLKDLGKATGVITSVQFSHATPAGFVAHNISRNNYAQIAQEMLLDSRTDVIMGCGHPWYSADGQQQTTPNSFSYVGGQYVWESLEAGLVDVVIDGGGTVNSVEDCDGDHVPDAWHLVEARADFQGLMAGDTPNRVLGVPQVSKTLQHDRGGDYFADPYLVPLVAGAPTLEEMARGALNVLDNDPEGFFLMVEGGAIDWASHGNASGRMIEEEIDFNHSVEAVVAWVNAHSNWDETLLIVTGDHECGFLNGPGSGPGAPATWNPIANHGAGVVPGMQWDGGDHTNMLIPLFAEGPGRELLDLFSDENDPLRGRFVNNTEIAQALFTLFPEPTATVPVPENIIVLISDGCGYNHLDAASLYQHGATGTQVYESWPYAAGMSTWSGVDHGYAPYYAWGDFEYVKRRPTDSAAAATAMSCGMKTYNAAIGMDVDRLPLEHIVQLAEKRGKATGVVTSVQFSHATPAGYVAHNVHRNNYAQIAREMLLDSPVDLIMGCGHPWFNADGEELTTPNSFDFVGGPHVWEGLVAGAEGFDTDGDGIVDNFVEPATGYVTGNKRNNAWHLVETREEFQALMTGRTPARVLGVPQVYKTLQHDRGGDYMADPYAVPLNETVPTLGEMTRGALNVLDANPNGFFLMVEGGAVDWAGHGNSIGRLIEEEIDFNRTVEAVVEWVETHSDWSRTLVIVTGDHETGYLTGPGSGGNPPVWNALVNNGAGQVPGHEWHSGDHTNSLIPVFAKGDAAALLPLFTDEFDPVRGLFINNSELSQITRLLWENLPSAPRKGPNDLVEFSSRPALESGALQLNIPTPRAGIASLHYTLGQSGPVRLGVFDVAGRSVATLVEGDQPAGDYLATWDVSRVPTGVYFARLETGTQSVVRKLACTK